MDTLVAALLAVVSPATSVPLQPVDAPFSPYVEVPDYVAEMTVSQQYREPGSLTVARHGDWARLDLVEKGIASTRYVSYAAAVSVRLERSKGAYESLYIDKASATERTSYRDRTPFKTGQRDTLLGETCEVWNVARSRETGPGDIGLIQFSCVTQDGIELWSKIVTKFGEGYGVRATKLIRRPVRRAAVQPPSDILDLDVWLEGAAPHREAPPSRPDAEVRLETDPAHAAGRKSVTVYRRRYPWTFTEKIDTDGSSAVTIEQVAAGLSLYAHRNGDGSPSSLSIYLARWPKPLPPPLTGREALDRTQVVLGETCRWWYVTVGMSDAGRNACITADELTLADEAWGWGGRGYPPATAISIRREALRPSDMRPNGDLLSGKAWGLAE